MTYRRLTTTTTISLGHWCAWSVERTYSVQSFHIMEIINSRDLYICLSWCRIFLDSEKIKYHNNEDRIQIVFYVLHTRCVVWWSVCGYMSNGHGNTLCCGSDECMQNAHFIAEIPSYALHHFSFLTISGQMLWFFFVMHENSQLRPDRENTYEKRTKLRIYWLFHRTYHRIMRVWHPQMYFNSLNQFFIGMSIEIRFSNLYIFIFGSKNIKIHTSSSIYGNEYFCCQWVWSWFFRCDEDSC